VFISSLANSVEFKHKGKSLIVLSRPLFRGKLQAGLDETKVKTGRFSLHQGDVGHMFHNTN
jgi:hypothetical protein